ncbi:hypothetical protein CJD36_021895 [Flavipsychrobacter stenotrophus]|uniref:Restriction endonuclease n=1 Tax=Flavipsychrobacter stenotrophus TaxID=2077091 RepID=A0A2S7SPV5_9BACT|nr:hypothetical protein [Flavipsychrobacter stenotrophus]PQJ08920.1 hypothetical protein CJD36_021895 [Flavipsychrobacter stenotrophus]
MSDTFVLIPLFEHHDHNNGHDASKHLPNGCLPIKFKERNKEPYCIDCKEADSKRKLHSAYFVGTDWLIEKEVAVYVEPKLNKDEVQIDILKMLLDSISNPDTGNYVHEIFEVKPDKPFITLPHHQDFITPLLMLHFLNVVKTIVRKGLKKSYYTVTENLYSKIKGKVLVSETIKKNLVKNKKLYTQCQYSEFGVNGTENRVLKKVLGFVQRYLDNYKVDTNSKGPFQTFLLNAYNYISPAFQNVSDKVELNDVRHHKFNPFFKEYKEGIELAQLILKRYGYNLNNIKKEEEVKVPPFWIDMTKLFELFVLAQLKMKYGNEVLYQFKAKYGWVDYLILRDNMKMVVDAKYKPQWVDSYESDDIRQVSGYARDVNVADKLGIKVEDRSKVVPNCLIIYSDQKKGHLDFSIVGDNEFEEIEEFVGFYKIGVKLPEVKTGL